MQDVVRKIGSTPCQVASGNVGGLPPPKGRLVPTLTLMEHAGVPISIISKWAGRYDSAFTQKTYVHASDDDLDQGRKALARIHKIA